MVKNKSITSFCVLAEPEKLMYPYIESIRSVSRFSNRIIINYASADETQEDFRKFEKSSYDKLLALKEDVKDNCEIILYLDTAWRARFASSEEYLDIIQRQLSCIEDGWFLKFDADNVFRMSDKLQRLFVESSEVDRLIFRRVDVLNKSYASVNHNCRDIYAVNVGRLKERSVSYSIKDTQRWCEVSIDGHVDESIVSSIDLIPTNYDATFFTKERIIDFWRRTEDVYSISQNRPNRYEGISDEKVLEEFISYKKKKIGSRVKNFGHPHDILEKINSMTSEHWGYNNFGLLGL